MNKIKYVLILMLILFHVFALNAAKWNPLRNDLVPVGARPIGLGGAFIAIADDANSIFYNPAGLTLIKHNEFTDSFNWNPNIKGVYKNFASFVYPFKKMNSIGIAWNYIWSRDPKPDGFSGDWVPELNYHEHQITLSYARKINEIIHLGLNIRYLGFSVDLDMQNNHSVRNFGIDVGGIFNINEKIRCGIVIDNIIPFKYYHSGSGGNEYRLPSFRAGISYSVMNNLRIAFDMDDEMHLGMEYWIHNIVSLRAGFKTGYLSRNEVVNNLQWALGFGIRYKFFEFNYAWPASPWLMANQVWSLSFVWGYQAYLVDVISTKIDDMFASLYKTYSRKDVVRIIVKNKTRNPVKASVAVLINGLMKNPVSKSVNLDPGVPTEVFLPIVFDPDKVIEVRDDSARTAKVIVSYDHNGRKSEDTTASKFVLYGRNAFVWDDIEKLGSFVTPQDIKVKEFARYVLQVMRAGGIREKVISNNFYKAMLIFDALGAYGQMYIADPSNPYGAGVGAIDYIQFPQETLKQKGGDCDDCTVLFASLLENVGIPTMLVDIPGHIFMMFDSGLNPIEAEKKFPYKESYIEIDGRIWVPVETTMFGKTFYSSWEEGVNSFKRALVELSESGNASMNLVDVHSSWEKYPSSMIKDKRWDIKYPAMESIADIFKRDVNQYLTDKVGMKFKEILKKYESDPNNIDLLNKLGIVYSKNGILGLGEEYFKRIIEKDPDNLKAKNNLGNVYLITGDYDKAISAYNQVLKINPNFSSAKKNLLKAKDAMNNE